MHSLKTQYDEPQYENAESTNYFHQEYTKMLNLQITLKTIVTIEVSSLLDSSLPGARSPRATPSSGQSYKGWQSWKPGKRVLGRERHKKSL